MGLLRKRSRDLSRQDRDYVGRTGEKVELQITSAQGCRITDEKGRSYIDFQMGSFVGNLGWNHPVISARLRDFEGPSYVAPQLTYEPWVQLAMQLAEITPGDLSHAYRVVSGTEANELAIQLAREVTGRRKVLGLEDAYHGNSIGVREHIEKKLALPRDAHALGRLETQLKARDVACLIMEPIALNLGVDVPTEEFMRGARELCHRYGTLLVLDEVACGFGRTGRLFATEYFHITPDIMTLGKAITNGHAPLSATIVTDAIADELEIDFYSTFGWHPFAVEAALATLAVWRDEQTAILDNVERQSSEIVSRLLAMPWKREVEIKIKGLAIAIEVEDKTYVKGIVERCRERGLIVIDEEGELMMAPALTVTDDDVREALDILEHALSE